MNTFGAANLYSIADSLLAPKKPGPVLKGKPDPAAAPAAPVIAMENVTKLPTGGLDGLVYTGAAYLVSSWGGKAVYRGALGGVFAPVLENLKAAADLGYDNKRKRVLVPRFMDNVVEAYDLN